MRGGGAARDGDGPRIRSRREGFGSGAGLSWRARSMAGPDLPM